MARKISNSFSRSQIPTPTPTSKQLPLKPCSSFLFPPQVCNRTECDCKGLKGAPGQIGPHGVPGAAGLPGDIGFDGPPGYSGERGVRGEFGSTGDKGYRVRIGER